MKRAAAALDHDLASPVVESFRVAVIDLDNGPLYLTDGRHMRMGGKELLPAVKSWGTLERGRAAITIRAEGLPQHSVWWINRRCRVYRVTLDQALVERGRLLLDGVIEAQPSEVRGELSLQVSRPLYLKPKMVPGLGIIDAASYPRASDQAMGKVKPLVFGEPERCPLLLIDGGLLTTLQAVARPGDVELVVADATAFPEAGQVKVDGVTYTYAGRDDTRFFGVEVTALHAAGTVVHEPKAWTYLAAGHAVSSIRNVLAGTRMQSGDISTAVSGGVTTLSNVPTIQRTAYQIMYGNLTSGGTVQRGSGWLTPPLNAKTGVAHTVYIYGHVDGDAATAVTLYDYDGASGSRTRTVTVNRGGVTQSGIYLTGASEKPRLLYDMLANYNLLHVTVEVDWQINPIQPNNTPASGSTTIAGAVLTNGLPLQGVVADSDSLRLPAGDRTVVNTFDLPLGTAWDWFTATDLEIELVSARTDLVVCVVQALLMIEHEPVSYVPAEPDSLTATVTGQSGNPADIARALAEAAGDRVAAAPFIRARDWYARQGWSFAHAIDSEQAARDLMYAVCDEALLGYYETDDGLAFVRHLDLGTPITEITERDLMAPAQVTWTALTDLANDITLRYRLIDGDTTRVLALNAATPDRWAVRGEAEAGGRLSTVTDSEWIADDATALGVLKGRMRLKAPLRRTFALQLRPAFSRIEAGDLVRHAGVICRADQPRFDGARISFNATEIPV